MDGCALIKAKHAISLQTDAAETNRRINVRQLLRSDFKLNMSPYVRTIFGTFSWEFQNFLHVQLTNNNMRACICVSVRVGEICALCAFMCVCETMCVCFGLRASPLDLEIR